MSTTVGVAGATGAVGQEIIKVLDAAPWRPDTLVPLAGAASSTPFVEYGGSQIAVDDLEHQVLDDLDLLFLATPMEIAREFGGRAIDDGVLTVDCSGAWPGEADVPLLVPWVNPERMTDAVENGVAMVPTAPALLISSILGPLRRAGIEGEVEAVVLLPASHWGRKGVEELSRQVVSLFNSATPPRKVFEHGLAFDLIPQTGPLDKGHTVFEARIAGEIAQLVGTIPTRIATVGVPVFSGVSADITVRADRHTPAELVVQILKDGGVVVPDDEGPRSVPRPRLVDGHPFAHAGRVQVDGSGTIRMWASMDNLRASAAAAVACGGALLKGVQV